MPFGMMDELWDQPEQQFAPMNPISIDWNKFSQPGPQVQRYRQLSENVPRRDDYQLDKGSRLGAAIAGGFMSLTNPKQGMETYRGIVDRPYREAMDQFNMESQTAYHGAVLENQQRDDERMMMQKVLDIQQQQARLTRDLKKDAYTQEHDAEKLEYDRTKDAFQRDLDESKLQETRRHNQAVERTSAVTANAAQRNADIRGDEAESRKAYREWRMKQPPKTEHLSFSEYSKARKQAYSEVAGEFSDVLEGDAESGYKFKEPEAPGLFSKGVDAGRVAEAKKKIDELTTKYTTMTRTPKKEEKSHLDIDSMISQIFGRGPSKKIPTETTYVPIPDEEEEEDN